jgi:hypothetical protein
MKNLFLSLLVLLTAACTGSSGIKLVQGGRSDYQIRIPDQPSAQEVKAAWYLQTYIKKATGAQLPIVNGLEAAPEKAVVIRVSDEVTDPDGFNLAASGKQLIILGGNHKGCIYGVVDLLEHQMGCRIYAPGFEVVPAMKSVQVNKLPRTDQPVNNYRNVYGRLSVSDSIYQDWQRTDVIDDMFAKGYYVHTFNTLIPWQKYFKDHPDYFALMNGKRIIDQPCLTHPEVLKITLAKLHEDIASQPDKMVWSVSQNDNFSYCQCDECMKVIKEEGSPAGPVIRFVNAVAKEFPDKIISTLAYQYSRQAPVVTKPADNVQIMLCTIELNRSQPIAGDPRSASFMKDIVDWGKISKHIYLWDYTVNFSHHTSPFPNMHVLQPNIQMFVKNNVFEHFQQSNTDVGHEFSEMKAYLLSRILWNPEVNTDSLITDFMQGYFGPAAPFVRTYLDTLQGEIYKTKEWLDIYGHPTAHQNTFLSESNVERYIGYFNQACEAVKDQPEYLLHVKTYELPVQYAAMEIGKNQMFSSRGWFTQNGDSYELRKPMRDMLEDFITTCREARVNTLSEAGLTPENYYQSTLRFIDLKIEGNLAFHKTVSAEPAPSEKYSSGDISYLTNGVRGASDYKVHWLGWEGQDFTVSLDMGASVQPDTIQISSLYDPKSWILHPAAVKCLISTDGKTYAPIGEIKPGFEQKSEPVTRAYQFLPGKKPVRFVKFEVKGILKNPKWHPSAGGKSWVFMDEVMIR